MSNSTSSKLPTTFDVAISAAGIDQRIVMPVAHALKAAGVSVFYDKFSRNDLWGVTLTDTLHELFLKQSKVCILFLSKAYSESPWTNFERKSILDRSLRDERFLLPIRLDSTEIAGLSSTVSYIDYAGNNPHWMAAQILRKLVRLQVTKQETIDFSKCPFIAFAKSQNQQEAKFKFLLNRKSNAIHLLINGKNTSEVRQLNEKNFRELKSDAELRKIVNLKATATLTDQARKPGALVNQLRSSTAFELATCNLVAARRKREALDMLFAGIRADTVLQKRMGKPPSRRLIALANAINMRYGLGAEDEIAAASARFGADGPGQQPVDFTVSLRRRQEWADKSFSVHWGLPNIAGLQARLLF